MVLGIYAFFLSNFGDDDEENVKDKVTRGDVETDLSWNVDNVMKDSDNLESLVPQM